MVFGDLLLRSAPARSFGASSFLENNLTASTGELSNLAGKILPGRFNAITDVGDALLRLAYSANILILVPVLIGLMFAKNGPSVAALGGSITESKGLRFLVASLWSAILLLSVAGLAVPKAFWQILVFQVVYKSIWLGSYVIPTWYSEGRSSVPWGPTISFAFIIVVWPILLFFASRYGSIQLTC